MAKRQKKKKPLHQAIAYGQKRYRVTTQLIKEYYTEKGEKKSYKEVISEYHRIKDNCKKVPLTRLESCIDQFFIKKEEHKFPTELIIFDWYYFKELLSETGWYFKDDDIIIIDGEIVGDSYEFPYSDLDSNWNIFYQQHSNDIRKDFKYPKFAFVDQSENVFTWRLESEEGISTKPSMPKEPEPKIEEVEKPIKEEPTQKEVDIQKSKERVIEKKIELTKNRIELRKSDEKLSKQRTEESKARQSEIKQLEKLLAKKIITVADFRKRFNKLK